MPCQYLSSKWHMTYRCSYAVVATTRYTHGRLYHESFLDLTLLDDADQSTFLQHQDALALRQICKPNIFRDILCPVSYVPGCCRSAISSSLSPSSFSSSSLSLRAFHSLLSSAQQWGRPLAHPLARSLPHQEMVGLLCCSVTLRASGVVVSFLQPSFVLP